MKLSSYIIILILNDGIKKNQLKKQVNQDQLAKLVIQVTKTRITHELYIKTNYKATYIVNPIQNEFGKQK